MKNTFAKMFTVCALAGVLGVAFIGCGDDGSSSPKGTVLPAEVADKAELETYECGMDVIGEKIYVADLELNYECDGEKWFKSYDQTKPSSTKSSSSKKTDGGDSSEELSSGTSFVPGSSDEGDSSEDLSSADGANDDNGKSQQGGSSQGKPGSSSDDSTSSMDESSSSSAAAENFCEPGSYDPDAQLCDVRDGKLYGIIRIGAQTWMAENLNFDYKVAGATYRNWCYNDSAKYCSTMGRLYTWGAAMDSAAVGCGHGRECAADTGRVKGVCPNDWHLPSPAEWDTLFAAVAEDLDTAGTALKTTSGWYDDGNGTDAFGFSALPSGNRSSYDGNFNNAGNYAYFWSSSEFMLGDAYSLYLNYADASAARGLSVKNFAFAVRCVKDSK